MRIMQKQKSLTGGSDPRFGSISETLRMANRKIRNYSQDELILNTQDIAERAHHLRVGMFHRWAQ